MRTTSRRRRVLPGLALAAALAACADNPTTPARTPQAPRPSVAAGALQWFGYAGSSQDEPTLIGTDSYANWGEVITDENASSSAAATQINALGAHGMKAVVELGKLLWAPTAYIGLYGDYVARWNTWKAANASALTSDKVIAFIIRDEPFSASVNMVQYQWAAAMVKADFPWAKIILIEAAQTVTCQQPGCYFPQTAGQVSSVDWIGVDRYAIDPRTDQPFRDAVSIMKAQFPGRKMVYVMDAYWNQTHADSLGIAPITIMHDVATWWYDVARADPDAVMLAGFIWGPPDAFSTGSRDLPPYVLSEHERIGREITGRSITHTHTPTGSFTIDASGVVSGWACDPDGAWGDMVTVRMFQDGVYYNQGGANLQDVVPHTTECRTGGFYHAIHIALGGGSKGHQMTATVEDLDGNQVALPTTCAAAPACVWYPNVFLPIGSASLSATGLLTGWACDKDAPTVSTQVRVAAGTTTVTTVTANVASEAAVNTQCGGGTAHRFSVQLPASTQGQTIYAYALDTMGAEKWIGPQTGRTW